MAYCPPVSPWKAATAWTVAGARKQVLRNWRKLERGIQVFRISRKTTRSDAVTVVEGVARVAFAAPVTRYTRSNSCRMRISATGRTSPCPAVREQARPLRLFRLGGGWPKKRRVHPPQQVRRALGKRIPPFIQNSSRCHREGLRIQGEPVENDPRRLENHRCQLHPRKPRQSCTSHIPSRRKLPREKRQKIQHVRPNCGGAISRSVVRLVQEIRSAWAVSDGRQPWFSGRNRSAMSR